MTIEDLIEIEQIKRLKYRYMRALDTHDWPLMRSLFVADARTWYSGGKFSAQGIDIIMSQFEQTLGPHFYSSHVALHPEIELISPAEATGYWRLEDTVHYIADGPADTRMRAGDELQGAGYYRDEYVKVDGTWLIRSMGYTRIYERIESRGQRVMQLDADPALGVLERVS